MNLNSSDLATNPRLVSAIYSLWRRSLLLLVLVILGVAIGFAGYRFWPKSYKAQALIMIEAQKVPDKYVSNTRLQKIVDDFHLFQSKKSRLYPEEILDLMRKSITIRLDKTMSQERASAFYVEFVGDHPSTVAEVTNRIVSLFLEQNLKERALSAEGTSEFLDSQLAEAKRGLEIQEKRLAEYKLAHEGSLPGQESYLMSVIARLQSELQFVEESISRASLSKANIESAMQSARTTDLLAGQLVEKATAKAEATPFVKPQSEILNEQLTAALTRYKPTHPTITELKDRIAIAKSQEALSAKNVVKEPVEEAPNMLRWRLQSKERDENFQNQLKLIDREMALRSAQRIEIISKIETQQRQLGQLPVRELQMGAITRDYEISLLTYKNLLDKGQHAHISSEMERRQKGERFKVVDPAKTPEKPLGLSLWLCMAIGGSAALLLSASVVLLLAFRRNVLLGEWELPQGMPVLTRIPIQKADKSSRQKRFPNLPSRWKFKILPSSN
jgi:polysaccharide biosynthesis transport protein